MLFEIERWATVVFFGLICIGAFGGVVFMIVGAWEEIARALLGVQGTPWPRERDGE